MRRERGRGVVGREEGGGGGRLLALEFPRALRWLF